MSFVKAIYDPAVSGAARWVKPDTLSDTFEMRKVTIPAVPSTVGMEGRPTTDVYELYWAHLILDSTVGQVLTWMRRLVFRLPTPPPLVLQVWIIRILMVILLLVIVGLPIYGASQPKAAIVAGSGLAVVAAVVVVVWKVFKPTGTKLLTGYVGDAARYFEPKPENIARRQEIREAGVRLLEKMHESGEYQRVVIAGHSLGSAIAYDMLTYTWNRLRRENEHPDSASYAALQAVEDALLNPLVTVGGARALQYSAWEEHRRNTQPWLVTDLITMGSPLTYGNYLMADSQQNFVSLTTDRAYPTCPPQEEIRKNQPRISYPLPNRSTDGDKQNTFIVPDHGAMFALTRWTNLYFPTYGLIGGDPVGGPLQPLFGRPSGIPIGRWISDRPVKLHKAGFWGFAHTHYWVMDKGAGPYIGAPDPQNTYEDHIDCLREALDLNTANRMRSIANQRPAYTYL